MNPRAIGENQVSSQIMQQVASDVASPQGQKQLFRKAVGANIAKQQLDAVMQVISSHLGATTTSRVKNIETAGKKIAQKRLQGRDYGIEDINDMLGSRLVVKNIGDINKAKKSIQTLSKAGVFDIEKEQQVKQGTYGAYHYDVKFSNGTKAEIQIHTPQSEAEAVINHSLRAVHGENPENKAVEVLRNKQARVAKDLPNKKAQEVTQAISSMMKHQDGLVSPIQSAQVLSQVKQQ